MELATRASSYVLSNRLRIDTAGILAWTMPFVALLYLALSNGGYDLVERSEVGIAVWWLLLVGALTGFFTIPREGRALKASLLLLAGLAAWTAASLAWTDSAERTVVELSRVLTFGAVFTLAITAQASGRWRAVLGGTTAAVSAVVVLAALSRMHPDLFPAQTTTDFLPSAELEARLIYPLNYSGGLAAFAAVGLPLLLRASAESRLIGMQALAAGLLPIAALTIWLTGSSLSVPLIVIGTGTYLLLATDRMPKLATLLAASTGAAILIAAVAERPALDRGLETAAAYAQGDELFGLAIVVTAGVALIQAALSLAVRHGNRPRALTVSRRLAIRLSLASAAVAIAVFLLSPAPGVLSDGWDDFRGPSQVAAGETDRTSQIFDVSSRNRYQYWETAVDAFQSAPLLGIGPGTYEFWWAENGSEGQFVRDAHSLYVEMLAELGLPGFLLILSLVGVIVIGGGIRAARAKAPAREAIAAATAGAAVFAAGAMFDWMWELGALTILFFVLAGIAVASSLSAPPREHRPKPLTKGLIAAVSLLGLIAIAIPFGSQAAIDESRENVAAGAESSALESAGDAEAVQPYAATPKLQRALILEQAGASDAAAKAARSAARSEPANWRNWLILARLEAKAGNARASVTAYREARQRNPESTLFSTP